MGWGREMVKFLPLFGLFLGVNGDDMLNSFIIDIISTFKLTSPTIIYHGEALEICMTHWVLCLDQENQQEVINNTGNGNP